jgi:hypothetical protein
VTIFDGVAVVDVLLPTMLFYHSMLMFFLRRKAGKQLWLDRTAIGVFVFYWLATFAFAESIKLKVFTTLLLLSLFIVRFLVGRQKKAGAQKSSQG